MLSQTRLSEFRNPPLFLFLLRQHWSIIMSVDSGIASGVSVCKQLQSPELAVLVHCVKLIRSLEKHHKKLVFKACSRLVNRMMPISLIRWHRDRASCSAIHDDNDRTFKPHDGRVVVHLQKRFYEGFPCSDAPLVVDIHSSAVPANP